MVSIRNVVICLSLTLLVALPSLASATECKVRVTDQGNPAKGAKVEGKVDGNMLAAVFTDETGLTKLLWTSTSAADVLVNGLVAGTCIDKLSVELSALGGQPVGTDATNTTPVGGDTTTGNTTDATQGQTTSPPPVGETSSDKAPKAGTDSSGNPKGTSGNAKGGK